MRLLSVLLFSIFLSTHVMAQDVTEPSGKVVSSAPGSVALLRGLDKVTAKTRDFEAPIGTPVTFGSLTITVKYCRKTPPEEDPEVYVFMTILDKRTNGAGEQTEGEQVFSGWMFGSDPALNALENPVYDVWVLDCKG